MSIASSGPVIPSTGTNADGSDHSSADVSGEILAYLNAHPRAADSLDGIVSWWLSRHRFEQARDRIQDGLDKLVERGLVERICLADGGILYGKSQARSTT
jgi:hypothetical protein